MLRTKSMSVLSLVGVAVLGTALALNSSSAPASAQGAIGPSPKCPTCPDNHVRFIGQDAAGDFQAALDDALVQADVYFSQFGADILYTYRVLGTSGRRGGFAGFNDICVEIEANL